MNDSLKDQLAALKHLIITKKETEMACGDKKKDKPSPKPKKGS